MFQVGTDEMEINDFAEMSYERAYKNHKTADDFKWQYFVVATGGEAGEILSLYKEWMRGDITNEAKFVDDILEEAADTITYALLLIRSLGANAEDIIMKKYEIVNKRLEAGGFDKRPENE